MIALLRNIGIGLCLLLMASYGLWSVSGMRTYQMFGEIVARGPTADSVVALTFDDGPTPGYTETILAVLDSFDVKATFFVTGREVESNSEQARKLVEAGHELGNHSYRHSRMVLMAPSTVRDEIERTDRAIRSTGYTGPIHFRPPYGKKLFSLPWYLSRHQRKTIMWDLEPESYAEVRRDADTLSAYVLDRAQPGSIVLLHVMFESRATSMAAVPAIIEGLTARGYRFVTVTELLN